MTRERLYPAKRDVIVYDYVDEAVPVLKRMGEKRVRGYNGLGYSIDNAPIKPDRGLFKDAAYPRLRPLLRLGKANADCRPILRNIGRPDISVRCAFRFCDPR